MNKMRSKRLRHTFNVTRLGSDPGVRIQTQECLAPNLLHVFTSGFSKEEGLSLKLSLPSVTQGQGLPVSAWLTIPSFWGRGSDWPSSTVPSWTNQLWSGAAGATEVPLSQEGSSWGRQKLCELEGHPKGGLLLMSKIALGRIRWFHITMYANLCSGIELS